MKFVIICGGFGTKMWPESRMASPKHFLPLINGKSLFQLNWKTLADNFPKEDIFLQTNPLQAEIARHQVEGIIEENIFIEPEMRDQGPATGFAAAMLYKKGFPDEPFMVIQSDLLRHPENEFIKMIHQFEILARRDGKLMTACHRPEFVVKGVDYLISGEKVTGPEDATVWRMADWLGREEVGKIEEYMKDGRALLHWNHYCWAPRKWMEAFKTLKADWYEPLMNIISGNDVKTEYAKMPKGPIEEITKILLKDGYIFELQFHVEDFGTWESVDQFNQEHGIENKDEKTLTLDSPDNLIRKKAGKVVALIGIKDTVVIDTDDALLICPKKQSGRVKEIVQALKDKNLTGYL